MATLTKVQQRLADARRDTGAEDRLNQTWEDGARVMVSRIYPATVIGKDARFFNSYFVRVDATGTTKSIGAISIFAPACEEDKELHPIEY